MSIPNVTNRHHVRNAIVPAACLHRRKNRSSGKSAEYSECTIWKEQCGQYELFPGYIEPYYRGFVGQKVKFARSVVEHMTLENMAGMLDVKKQVMELGKRISDWNGEPFH